MNTLSDTEKIKLRSILTDTNLYERAKRQVVANCCAEVIGSSRAPLNIALDMAVEKGVIAAFNAFENLLLPDSEKPKAVTPKSLLRKSPTNKH